LTPITLKKKRNKALAYFGRNREMVSLKRKTSKKPFNYTPKP
jgi:hypothetical protein